MTARMERAGRSLHGGRQYSAAAPSTKGGPYKGALSTEHLLHRDTLNKESRSGTERRRHYGCEKTVTEGKTWRRITKQSQF